MALAWELNLFAWVSCFSTHAELSSIALNGWDLSIHAEGSSPQLNA